MRRTVIIPVVLHALVAVATLLWLLWYFIPTGNVFKGLATLLILLLAGWTVFKNCRSEEHTSDVTLPAAELPLLDTQGPVVLVCGDMLEALFQGGPLRKTAQGWWLRAGDVISVGTMGNLTALAGEKLGLFARTGQLSVKSGEGPIDVQAQNASMRLFAEKKLTLSSVSDILFAGKKRITLIGGGSYLRLEAGKVEYGTTASYIRKVKRTMAAGSSPQSPELPFLPGPGDAFRRSFILVDDRTQEPISNIGYELTSSIGKVVKGFSCEKGLTGFISHTEEADIELTILKQNSLYIG
ncbi:DUF2345 domain-containing protein [Enterobacter ludwigii]